MTIYQELKGANNMGIKEGYKTTEFWMALIPQLLSVLVILGVLSPEESIEIGELVLDGVEKWFALVASAVAAWGYAKSRGEAKSSEFVTVFEEPNS